MAKYIAKRLYEKICEQPIRLSIQCPSFWSDLQTLAQNRLYYTYVIVCAYVLRPLEVSYTCLFRIEK